MANENTDDTLNNDNTQDTGNTQGGGGEQQVEQLPSGEGKEWDKILDNFISTNDRGSTAGGETQQQVKKPGEQQQQAPQKPGQQGGNQQQQRPGNEGGQQTRTPNATPREFGNLFRADARGDVYNAQGKLIAKQGYGRSVFHEVYNTVAPMLTEAAGLRTRLETYENANKLAKDAGLSLDEQGAAMRLMVEWKRDPVKTLGTLLTLAEGNGKDVTSIRQGGGGLNAADLRTAVQEIVGDAIKPFSFLLTDREQQQQQRDVEDQVQTDYNAFIQQFPDAVMHDGSIANVMRDHGLNHREAYFAVRSWVAENGLDWKKPLAQQLQGRAPNNGGNRAPSGAGNNRPLPNMGGRRSNDDTTIQAGSRTDFNAEDSWDKIGRAVFKQHGIDLG